MDRLAWNAGFAHAEAGWLVASVDAGFASSVDAGWLVASVDAGFASSVDAGWLVASVDVGWTVASAEAGFASVDVGWTVVSVDAGWTVVRVVSVEAGWTVVFDDGIHNGCRPRAALAPKQISGCPSPISMLSNG